MNSFLEAQMKYQPSTIKSQPLSVDRLRLWLLIAVVGVIASMASAASVFAQIVGTAQLHVERRGHTATLLQDGKVLIVGGDNQTGMISQAEIFDPAVQTSSLAASASIGRTDHTATRLADGRVLIIGGRDQNGALGSTEIYDPSTASFAAGPSLTTARSGHTATSLSDDKILVTGGAATGSAELYNPATQSFSLVSGNMNAARKFHSAILTSSGQVLIVGGIDAQNTMLNTAEVFDPASQSFYIPPTDMQTARALATLKLLPDGKVQIIGGDAELSMEVFDPTDGIFVAKALLPPNANLLGATLSTQSRAALFSPLVVQDPLLQSVMTPEQLALLDRADQSITELPSRNQALVAGGIDSAGQTLNSAKLVSSSSASITTDKTDYAPGQIVTITGSGFQPNEQVDIYFHEFPEEYPDVFFSVVANQQGNFVTAEFAPQEIDLGRIFTLTAIGQTSGFTAQTAFKDDNRVTFSNTANGAGVTAFGTIDVNQCRTAFVQARQGGGLDNADANRVVNLSSNPAGATFFSTSDCTGSSVTSVTVAMGTSSKQFSFRIGTTGSFTIAGNAVDFSGANDASATVTVQAAALHSTATNVSCSPGNIPVNNGTTCTATVIDTDTAPTSTPTGTVTFNLPGGDSGGFSSATCNLSSGSCSVTYTPSAVGDGAHSIGASYGGSATHAISSDPTPFNVIVNRLDQTINVTMAAPADAFFNATFNVAATGGASGNAVVITVSGVCSVNSGGNNAATILMTSGTGNCTVHYNQAGNANYNAATEVTSSTAAKKLDQTINVTTPAPPSALFNTTFNVAATSAGSSNPVVITASGVCSISSGGNDAATILMTSGTGTCTVKYNQAGNDNYNAAPEVSSDTTAQKADQTISFSTPPLANAIFNTNFTVVATASSGLPVSYSATGVCSNVAGVYTMTSGTGTCTVQVDQAGNANYNPAPQLTQNVTAQKANATINVTGFTGMYDGLPHGATGSAIGVLSEDLSASLNLGDTFTIVPGGTAYWTFTGGTNYNDANGSVEIVITTAFAYSGFYPPIGGSVEYGNGGSYANPLKTFKLNSTIPVKFSATWLNGGAALITGIHRLEAIKYSNSTDSDPPIDATPTDAATTGNQFRLTGTDWHFNLSTRGLTDGKWLLMATLEDGSQHTVWITIKK